MLQHLYAPQDRTCLAACTNGAKGTARRTELMIAVMVATVPNMKSPGLEGRGMELKGAFENYMELKNVS